VAKKFEKTTVSDVSEDSTELETETAAGGPASPAGVPPAKVAAGARSGSSGDGGRRPSKAAPKHGFFARVGQFLRDTRAEMRRVSWPTAVMVKNTTIITLIAVVFFALYLFAVDKVWAFLIERLRGLLGG
jgi:preprotein translocase subunit SecE